MNLLDGKEQQRVLQETMGNEKKRNLLPGQAFYIAATIFLALGILAVIAAKFVNITISFHYPCVLKEVFHIYCPGCGGTRAVNELLHLHIVQSFLANPIVLYMAGIFLYYYIGTTLAVWCQGRRRFFRGGKWIWVVGIIVFVANVVLRNYLAMVYGIDYLGDIAKYW